MICITPQINTVKLSVIGRFFSETEERMATLREFRHDLTNTQAGRAMSFVSQMQKKPVKDLYLTITERLEKVTP